MAKQNGNTPAPKTQSNALPSSFRNINRAAYEMAYLLKSMPADVNPYRNNTDEVRDKAAAFAQHADNAFVSVLSGLQAIGGLLVMIGCSEEKTGLDEHQTTAIGDLIQHLAVEAEMLSHLGEEMDSIAKGGAQ